MECEGQGNITFHCGLCSCIRPLTAADATVGWNSHNLDVRTCPFKFSELGTTMVHKTAEVSTAQYLYFRTICENYWSKVF